MRSIFLSLLILAPFLYACSSEAEQEESVPTEEFDLITVFDTDSLCSIGVLPGMIKTKQLNDRALIQMSNLLSAQYLSVVATEKVVANSFAEEQFSRFINQHRILKSSDEVKLTVDSIDILAQAFDIKEYGKPKIMSYWLACVQGSKNDYLIKLWTPQERKHLFEKQANAIIRSFKELK